MPGAKEVPKQFGDTIIRFSCFHGFIARTSEFLSTWKVPSFLKLASKHLEIGKMMLKERDIHSTFFLN